MIEFALENEGLPVGRIHSQFVYPLTFVEFLDAIGREELANIVRQFLVEDLNPIPMVIHEELLAQLKVYFRIGGLPKVVATYVASQDLAKVSAEQEILVRGYINDFRKYSQKSDWTLLESIFEKMGELAGGSQVKFSKVAPNVNSIQARRALSMAMVAHKILPVHTSQLPLAAHAVDKRFKLAFLDIGLLHNLLGFDWRRLPDKVDLTDVADGRLAEQFVAQELIASRGKKRSKRAIEKLESIYD